MASKAVPSAVSPLTSHSARPSFSSRSECRSLIACSTSDASSRRCRRRPSRSEEHTSELQSRSDLVCRLMLEKKKKKKNNNLHKKKKKKKKKNKKDIYLK